MSLLQKKQANYFQLISIWKATPLVQITVISTLFVLSVIQNYSSFIGTGQLGDYPLNHFLVFAPIYEEVIFRGLVFSGLTRTFGSVKKALIVSSLLFGLWHLKNIFFLSPLKLGYQIFYAGLIIGPVLAFLTYKTKSIWPGVIVHFTNNLIAPFTWKLLDLLIKL